MKVNLKELIEELENRLLPAIDIRGDEAYYKISSSKLDEIIHELKQLENIYQQ
jgi:hypothetical protein